MNSIDQSEESIYLTHVSGQSDGESSVEEHEGQSRQFIDCPENWKFSNLNNNVSLASK